MIKVFGIGNILLGDDAIGIRVAENLKDKLENYVPIKDFKKNDIKVFIGETDYIYCLDNINDDDFVILIDSTNFMLRPGSVTAITFEECDELIFNEIDNSLSAHEDSLLKFLRVEKAKIKGYLIGVEIANIDYSVELSKELSKKFDVICEKVYREIIRIL